MTINAPDQTTEQLAALPEATGLEHRSDRGG